MNILGLITARGGSKSIPHKNITPLAGKPLLAYTCQAALASRYITRVVLSTDDEAIAAVGRDCGVEVPFMRPPELAQDETPSLVVAQHAIRWLIEQGWNTDVLVLLQPTSPLRQALHIDECIELKLANDVDTVVSVIEVPHRFSPYAIMKEQDGFLVDYTSTDELSFNRYRRQELPKLYARNGPAVLVSREHVIMNQNTFYGAKVMPYLMNMSDSIDIDTMLDLELAGWFLARQQNNAHATDSIGEI